MNISCLICIPNIGLFLMAAIIRIRTLAAKRKTDPTSFFFGDVQNV